MKTEKNIFLFRKFIFALWNVFYASRGETRKIFQSFYNVKHLIAAPPNFLFFIQIKPHLFLSLFLTL